MEAGTPATLGSTPLENGVNFALYSSCAERVEVCLFDTAGHEIRRIDLPECSDDIWHGCLPNIGTGQRYGFRVHGPWDPLQGLFCNPAKLLLDPYARQLAGEFQWHQSSFAYASGEPQIANTEDSAPYVPKSVVCADGTEFERRRQIPWAETLFYELNVRGFTMRHPALNDAHRGTFAGLCNQQVIDHLLSLGVSSIELMPVHAFIDEHHLTRNGLRNYWGYNSVAFFAPANRYAADDPVAEFRNMVRTLHDSGMEVILDVAYNHTGEGDRYGPTLGFRGIDNRAYYRVEADNPADYVNDTGCGNTLNADHPTVQRMILDSLRYWSTQMGVDGFRFDLATVLGRHEDGFSTDHPLLLEIGEDPILRDCKLIAEPWDPGPGGYQLSHFPKPWAEWNDRFRDSARRFWRGDDSMSGELARRLRGSADLFEGSGRGPAASINFVTNHDGFTMADVAAYEQRHNEANGENNRDGHAHNFSFNHGIEGPTSDPDIQAERRRHRLNLMATLLLAQGTPLLLAGDEFGHSQGGNNNAYAQDNEIAWLDWSGIEEDPTFLAACQELLRLRRETPLVHLQEFVHGSHESDSGRVSINWINPDSGLREDEDWQFGHAFGLLIDQQSASGDHTALAMLFNAWQEAIEFELPAAPASDHWQVVFCSATEGANLNQRRLRVEHRSIALLKT